MVSLIAAACGTNTVVTRELGQRSDELANPAASTTTTQAPTTTTTQAAVVGPDRAAQSNLRNSLATEKAYFSVYEAFTDDVVTLSLIEPNLFDTGDDPVTVSLSPRGNVCLEASSDSGSYWGIWNGISAGTRYGVDTEPMFAGGCPDSIESHPFGEWSIGAWTY